MPRQATKPAQAGWSFNRAANGLDQVGAFSDQFYALKPGDELSPEMQKIMYNLEGRAIRDNLHKFDARKGQPWKASKLTATEKAWVWAKSYGKCQHKFCGEPWLKLHYRTGQKARMTIDHIKPKAEYPDLTWKLDNWQLMCHSCNSYKGTREDFTDEVTNEVVSMLQQAQIA